MQFRPCTGLVACPEINSVGEVETVSWGECRKVAGDEYVKDLKIRNRSSGESAKITYPCVQIPGSLCTVGERSGIETYFHLQRVYRSLVDKLFLLF